MQIKNFMSQIFFNFSKISGRTFDCGLKSLFKDSKKEHIYQKNWKNYGYKSIPVFKKCFFAILRFRSKHQYTTLNSQFEHYNGVIFNDIEKNHSTMIRNIHRKYLSI